MDLLLSWAGKDPLSSCGKTVADPLLNGDPLLSCGLARLIKDSLLSCGFTGLPEDALPSCEDGTKDPLLSCG